MGLNEAEIITHRGVDYLVFPMDDGKNPTLKAIKLLDIYGEDYDIIYRKYTDERYKDELWD